MDNPFTNDDKSANTPLDLVSLCEQIWRRGYPMNQLFSIELIMDFNNQSRNMFLIAPPSFSIPSHYLVSTGNSSTSRQHALTRLIAQTFRLLGQEAKGADLDAQDLLDFERRMAMVSQNLRIEKTYFFPKAIQTLKIRCFIFSLDMQHKVPNGKMEIRMTI